MTDNLRPLDGYRVLDFTQNVAGPLAGTVLADLGAEVIKIEAPGGEAARRITSTIPGLEHIAPYFLPNNRGKKSVMVDLRTDEGKEQVLALADTADVILDAFRPGVLDRLGLGAKAVQARNPRCVYASLSAYGGDGEEGRRPGIDILVQAESGLMTGLTADDGRPLPVRSTIIDAASGHVLAQAVLAALLGRERHGKADVVRIAMYDVACSLQSNSLTMAINSVGAPEPPADGRSPYATTPSGVFPAAENTYLMMAAYVPKHWALLTELLERPDLAADPRFADQAQRSLHNAALTRELSETFASRTADAWEKLLRDAGLMAVKVNDWSGAVGSAVFAESGLAVTVTAGERSETVVRTPARYAGFSPAGVTPTPLPGEHNEELLGGR
ncbi:CaiB/BaiF CoA transferase family protein [Streptomyces sp. DT195]|uniref:CaiB/BaiF CoA transferase family protein n=1 Tax=Streptomyces sp. DT195 TaxID=3393419 RepID=UPI003CF25029